MSQIRVLIVDDSVVARRLVSSVLEAEPLIDIVAVAATGRIALARLPQVKPDVVILDVEMPELDGLATLREIRKLYPKLPVIMFSTMTERGAAATIEALSSGATDYVTKPANVESVNAGIEHVRTVLLPKIMAACLGKPPVASGPVSGVSKPRFRPALGSDRVDILAIGSSTGGPSALTELLSLFPADFPVPVVIVQHMPPVFTRLLAEQLGKKAQLTVTEAVHGEPLKAGHVLIAPGDFHFEVARNGENETVVQLNQNPPENSCRPAADVLFRSVAEVFGSHALAVVLTGMGQDGCLGSEVIHDAGGRIIAQDEASSVVWGMAGSVVRAGLADGVWPLSELGGEIARRIHHTRPFWDPRLLSPADK